MKHQIRQTLKIYARFSWAYPGALFGLIAAVITGQVLSLSAPLQYKRFFDALSGTGTATYAQLVHVLWVIVAIYATEWVVRRLLGEAGNRFQTRVSKDLYVACFAYLHKHSFAYFNNNFVGGLVKRVNRFVNAFERVSDRLFWNLLPLVVNVIMILVILSIKSVWLGLVVLVWVVLFAGINLALTKYKMPHDLARSEAETKANGLLADSITNHSNVKLFNGYERELANFAAANEEVRRRRKFALDLDAWFEVIQTFFTYALEIGVLYLAIHLWQKGKLTLGDFVMIQSYLLTLFWRIWDFGRMIRHTFEDLADANEMTEVFNTPHEITDTAGAVPLVVRSGEVVFNNVSFNYHKTRPILTNFSLTIAAGERVAFVGPSGAGKSTVVKLLLRQHDITAGKIKIDGQEIRKVTQESLWQAVSYVPQEPILFHRSLLENIRYGRPEATDEQVIEAAKRARCHEFISELPDKYQTFVGERGVKLSGGERQRVAIARAILRNAPILVLDEATSSLDSESEHLIQEALNELMNGKTVIVIAHRLSTIMSMDRIIVVEHGTIRESGTHTELLAQNGLYRELWSIQAGGFLFDSQIDNWQKTKNPLQ